MYITPPHHTSRQPTEAPSPSHSPLRVLVSVWIVTIIFTGLFAEDIHLATMKQSRFQTDQRPALSYVTSGIRILSGWAGLSSLGRSFQSLSNPLESRPSKLFALRSKVPQVRRKKPQKGRLEPRKNTDKVRRSPKRLKPRRRPSKLPLQPAPTIKRLLLVGASSMFAHPGTRIERRLRRDYRKLKVKRLGKISSSLSRPDYFDWPKTLKLLKEAFQPDLVLANFGFNDIQALPYQRKGRTHYVSFGQDLWKPTYLKLLGPFLDLMEENDADIAWLGYGRMKDPKQTEAVAWINDLYRAEIRKRGGHYFSWWRLTQSLTDPKELREEVSYKGKTAAMRMKDGIHFSILGARFVARAFCQQLERHYHLTPKNPRLGVVRKYTWIPSLAPKGQKRQKTPKLRKKRKRRKRRKRRRKRKKRLPQKRRKLRKKRRQRKAHPLSILAYLPRTPKHAKTEKPPVLFLHYTGRHARHAPIEAHRLLQGLAQRYKVAIVTPIDPTLDSAGPPQPLPRTRRVFQTLKRLLPYLPVAKRYKGLTHRIWLRKKKGALDWSHWRRRLRRQVRWRLKALQRQALAGKRKSRRSRRNKHRRRVSQK